MKKTYKMIKSFINDESGATAVEYGIMVALIAAVIIVMVGNVGEKTNDAFEAVDTALTPVADPG